MTTSGSGGVGGNMSNQQAVGGINQGVDPYAPDPTLVDMPTPQVAATGTNKGGGSSSSVDAYDPNSAQAIEEAEIQQQIEDEAILASSNDPNAASTTTATGPMGVYSDAVNKEQASKGNPNAVSSISPTQTGDAVEQQGRAHRRRMRHSVGGIG